MVKSFKNWCLTCSLYVGVSFFPFYYYQCLPKIHTSVDLAHFNLFVDSTVLHSQQALLDYVRYKVTIYCLAVKYTSGKYSAFLSILCSTLHSLSFNKSKYVTDLISGFSYAVLVISFRIIQYAIPPSLNLNTSPNFSFS